MKKLVELIHEAWEEGWHIKSHDIFKEFLANGERYPKRAFDSISIRSPKLSIDGQVPFTALIHPSNPESGAYGGMSFVIFPLKDRPALISMGIGTQGLSPDENILGRPGHGRKVQAICSWINRQYGEGNLVAWAKQDPVRIDEDVPQTIGNQFSEYMSVLNRYGKVLYGFFAPTDNQEATELVLKAFMDLSFEERGIVPLTKSLDEYEEIRTSYLSHLMPSVSNEEIFDLLRSRRFIILEGPPGTGKTMMALELLEKSYGNNGTTIQFHPNVTYEQFVGGLAPVKSDGGFGFRFEPKKGFLMEAVEKAKSSDGQPFLLNIDEINRGDLAKVLGEAILLFEPTDTEKREVHLPYDFGSPIGSTLKLPSNLHILGTMNTADRSIAIVDVAIL